MSVGEQVSGTQPQIPVFCVSLCDGHPLGAPLVCLSTFLVSKGSSLRCGGHSLGARGDTMAMEADGRRWGRKGPLLCLVWNFHKHTSVNVLWNLRCVKGNVFLVHFPVCQALYWALSAKHTTRQSPFLLTYPRRQGWGESGLLRWGLDPEGHKAFTEQSAGMPTSPSAALASASFYLKASSWGCHLSWWTMVSRDTGELCDETTDLSGRRRWQPLFHQPQRLLGSPGI